MKSQQRNLEETGDSIRPAFDTSSGRRFAPSTITGLEPVPLLKPPGSTLNRFEVDLASKDLDIRN